MGEGEREAGGKGEGEGESFVGEAVVVRRGSKRSEVVEVGDSGLSSFTSSSTLCLLLLLIKIASMKKQPRLLFFPILLKLFSSTGLSSGVQSFYISLSRCRSESSATPINGRNEYPEPDAVLRLSG